MKVFVDSRADILKALAQPTRQGLGAKPLVIGIGLVMGAGLMGFGITGRHCLFTPAGWKHGD